MEISAEKKREDQKVLRTKALQEISDRWNIEAKQESTEYFCSTGESQELLNGRNISSIFQYQTFISI